MRPPRAAGGGTFKCFPDCLRKRSIAHGHVYDVFAVLAFVIACGDRHRLCGQHRFSTDIVDGQVKQRRRQGPALTTFDVSTLVGADIVDGSLTARDVGENEFNISLNVPAVAAHDCLYMSIAGIAAQGDHVLLTPDYGYTSNYLTYNVEFQEGSPNAYLKVCNASNNNVEGRPTYFNVLVFQH